MIRLAIDMSHEKKFIYVAGPLNNGGKTTDRNAVIANVERAMDAGSELMRLGYYPFVPHLSFWWDERTPRSHGEWLDLDYAWIRKCDAVLRLPGESRGTDAEEKFCSENGIPVFRDLESLDAFFRDRS